MSIDPRHARQHPGGPMSVEEYLYLDRMSFDARYEYIGGVARLMAGGSVAHDRIAYNTRVALDLNFRSGPCTVFGSDMQVLVASKADGRPDYCYPDVTISCDVDDRKRGNNLIRSPRLVVEVLSPSTEEVDRGEKLRKYQACPTVYEIVFISQFAHYVEVRWRDEEDETVWHSANYSIGEAVELASLDISIPIEDIYRGINFNEPL